MSKVPHDSIKDLPPIVQDLLAGAVAYLRRGDYSRAQPVLERANELAPEHSELMRLLAVALHMQGRFLDAADVLKRIVKVRPYDPAIYNNLGSALGASGDSDGSVNALERACELAPERTDYWFNLAKALVSGGRTKEACSALTNLLTFDPNDFKARLTRADLSRALGKLDSAEADLREILTTMPYSIEAWVRLVNLKSSRLSDKDMECLAQTYEKADHAYDDHVSLGFAYGQALESARRYADAFSVLTSANAAKKRKMLWSPDAIRQDVEDMMLGFSRPVAQASDPTLGREAILIFGMPRSGSTLLEQVLSAHPLVEGAGEIGDLSIVLLEECNRRGAALSTWVSAATPEDWTRLGQAYLDRTTRWREQKPMFTDKELGKWRLIGAAQAMLPAAHFIHCIRDPLETCWSCFKLEFERDMHYSYDLDHLATYWKQCDRLVNYWKKRHPGKIYDHIHERFVAEPENEVRRLLEFCDLRFHPSCLNSHESRREVHTASAGQVRQPIQPQRSITGCYGRLLDPLRTALGAP